LAGPPPSCCASVPWCLCSSPARSSAFSEGRVLWSRRRQALNLRARPITPREKRGEPPSLTGRRPIPFVNLESSLVSHRAALRNWTYGVRTATGQGYPCPALHSPNPWDESEIVTLVAVWVGAAGQPADQRGLRATRFRPYAERHARPPMPQRPDPKWATHER